MGQLFSFCRNPVCLCFYFFKPCCIFRQIFHNQFGDENFIFVCKDDVNKFFQKFKTVQN